LFDDYFTKIEASILKKQSWFREPMKCFLRESGRKAMSPEVVLGSSPCKDVSCRSKAKHDSRTVTKKVLERRLQEQIP
jgi:hypothetical protein